ncbi:MAG: M23 family metallopeptidase [Leadbetterella sp.]|nr:M23 family metallopeptidase [Leadbetterella sp.]
MILRILLLLIGSVHVLSAQYSYKNDVDDYWEKELSPMTDLGEVVNYIHNDPFKHLFIHLIPAGNPLEREIEVNSFYGARKHPVHKVLKFHRGIDLEGKTGEYVISSGNGVVSEAGFQEDLGYFVKIRHKYGFESIYGHLSRISVKKGQEVHKNNRIGKVGASGKVTGPHLHYTLKKNGEYLDPFDFLFMKFEEEGLR